MKKLTLSLAFLLSCIGCFGQFEVASHNILNKEFFKKNDGEYFYFQSGASYQTDEVTLFDENVSNFTFATGFYSPVDEAFVTNDSSVIILSTNGFDVIDQAIIRFDKDWNLMSYEYIGGEVYNATNGVELSNGYLIISDGHLVEAVDTAFNPVWAVEISGDLSGLFVVEDDSTTLAVTSEGTFLISIGGELIQTYPDKNFQHFAKLENENWVGQKADSLYLLAPNLATISQVGFPNEEVLDLKTGYGKVAILTKERNIFLFDDALNLLDGFMLQGTNLQSFDNFELAPDGIIVIGSTIYSENDWAAFIKKYGWDGTNIYTENNDIGIVSSDLGNDYDVEPYGAYFMGSLVDSVIRLTYHDPVFTVKNYGETTIQRLNINTKFPIFYVGGWNYSVSFNGKIRYAVNGLSIAPGEEVEVVLDKIEFYFKEYPNGEFYDECFWASRPNGRVDDDPTNDSDCSGFAVNAREENILPELIVFPNPAISTLHISHSSPLPSHTSFSMYHQTGHRIHHCILPPHTESLSVNLPVLADGLYFWKVSSEKGKIDAGKVLIQN